MVDWSFLPPRGHFMDRRDFLQATASLVLTPALGGTSYGSPATSGLGAQDLARSQPNLGAVDQADALRLDGDQARQFASSAALSSRQVDALPEPAPVPAQTSNPAQSNIN